MALRLVFLGPPGTGKGTQAARLSERLDLAALSSGDVLRREIDAQTLIGRAAAEFVRSGKLVPDEVITGVMLAAIDRLASGQGFILDGFPRTVPQAEALERGLAQRGSMVQAALDFRCPVDEITRRIAGRRVCSNCQATYNVSFLPPRVAERCDRCGNQLTQRVDDREDVIRTRLSTYAAQTAPLVDFYTQRGLLRPVDATVAASEVESAIGRIVDSLGQDA